MSHFSKIAPQNLPPGAFFIYRTSERNWIGNAIQAILDGDDVMIEDDTWTGRRCYIPAAALTHPDMPAWTLIWRCLNTVGIPAPRWPK